MAHDMQGESLLHCIALHRLSDMCAPNGETAQFGWLVWLLDH